MHFTDFFIRRAITTTLLMAAILVFGVISYFSLPVSNLPVVEYPTIQVSAALPGANPDVMASSVATPLEAEFSTIAGLNSMSSSSSLGYYRRSPCSLISAGISMPPRKSAGGHFARSGKLPHRYADAALLFEGESGRATHPLHRPEFRHDDFSQLDQYAETMMAGAFRW